MDQERAFKIPHREMLKEKEEKALQREAQKKEVATTAISGLWDQIAKEKSLMDKILNFVTHPFVLVGGLIATMFFLTRGKQDNPRLETQNADLFYQIKKLKKKNKKLKAKLELLSGNNDKEENQLSLRKTPLGLPQADSRPQTFYLD